MFPIRHGQYQGLLNLVNSVRSVIYSHTDVHMLPHSLNSRGFLQPSMVCLKFWLWRQSGDLKVNKADRENWKASIVFILNSSLLPAVRIFPGTLLRISIQIQTLPWLSGMDIALMFKSFKILTGLQRKCYCSFFSNFQPKYMYKTPSFMFINPVLSK